MGATVVKQTKAQRDAQRRRERIEEAKKPEQGGNVAPTIIGAQTFTPLQMYLCFGEGVNTFIRANAQVPFYSLSEPYYILNWLRGQVPAAELATLPVFPGIIHMATTTTANGSAKTGQKKTPKVQPDNRTMGAGAGGGTTEQPQV